MGKSKSNKKHVHMYHYIDLGYGMVWACALPDCSHFMPLIYKGSRVDPRLVGKQNICWECREPGIITVEAMEDNQIRCAECIAGTKRIKKSAEQVIADIAMKSSKARRTPEEQAQLSYEFMWGAGSWDKLSELEKEVRIEKEIELRNARTSTDSHIAN